MRGCHQGRWVRPAVTGLSAPLRLLSAARWLSVVAHVPSALLGVGCEFGVSPPCYPRSAPRQVAAGERGGAGALPAPRGLQEEEEGAMLCFAARCCSLEVALQG